LHAASLIGKRLILFRTQQIDSDLAAFSEQVRLWSGEDIAFVIDERNGPVDVPHGIGKVGITPGACEALGLYCPDDFAWRCGDYGLYLARQKYTDEASFWLIEDDVRFAGANPQTFFDFFKTRDENFLSSYLKPAQQDWYWRSSLLNCDSELFKCFFPVCRFSASALDYLLRVRQFHAQQWCRRQFWPNDEGFVATTLLNSQFSWADLNDCGGRFYREDQFHFESVIDGAQPLPCREDVCLFHPVLRGEALRRKRERLATRENKPGLTARVGTKLDHKVGTAALARWQRRRQFWAPHNQEF
jgi:hypothetical protein